MACEKLRQGLILNCAPAPIKYYQQVVLVNRNDVANSQILTSTVDINDNYTCRHRVTFDLLENKTGYRFSVSENASTVYASFNKIETEDIPQYTHNVFIIVSGVSEQVKCILKQLDLSDYFAAVQSYDGTIEIYGFEYGLTTSNYNYDPHNNGGGIAINLISNSDAPEDEPPFVYGGDPSDFDNNFSEIVFEIQGDFNDDFNNDFNNQE